MSIKPGDTFQGIANGHTFGNEWTVILITEDGRIHARTDGNGRPMVMTLNDVATRNVIARNEWTVAAARPVA